MLKIAFLRDGPFLPPFEGGSASILGLMRAMSKHARVYLYRCYRGWDAPELYKNQPFETVFIKPTDFYSNKKLFNHLNRKYEVDVYQFDSAEAVNLQKDLVGDSVLRVWEVLNINYVLAKQLGGSPRELKRHISQIKLAVKNSHLVLTRSTEDTQKLQGAKIDTKKVFEYKGCIDVSEFEFNIKASRNKNVLFLGNMFYKPNENCTFLIIKQIAPEVIRRIPDSKFIFVGHYPQSFKKQGEYFCNKFIFTGPVTDLTEVLQNSSVGLAPIQQASGTRLKILTYLAGGLPTVTTNLGIEGLKKDIKNHLIIEDNIREYPQKIVDLLNSEPDMEALIAGRKWVKRFYSWDSVARRLIGLYTVFKKKGVPGQV